MRRSNAQLMCAMLSPVAMKKVWSVMVLATAAKFAIEPVAEFVVLATVFQVLQFSLVGVVLGVVHRGPVESAHAIALRRVHVRAVTQ